jgi:hypothetical protein
VMRALDRDANKRYPSCAAFADALEAAAALKDKVASPRELAAYVNEVMGQEIAQQRDNVRSWLAQSETSGAAMRELPSGILPSSSVSAAAISLPGFVEASHSGLSGSFSTVEQPKRSPLPLVLGALLLAGLLGVGGFMLTRSVRSVGASAASPAGETKPAPPPVPSSAVPDPEATAVAAAASAAAASAAALPPPTPASALGVAPPPLGARGALVPPATRLRKKKSSDDVDLRNPYR